MQKQYPYIYYLQDTHFRTNDTHKVSKWKKEVYAKRKPKENQSSDTFIIQKKKNPLKYRLLEKTKKGHHIMIKRSIQECL